MQVSTMMLAAALTMFGTQNISSAADENSTVLTGCLVEAMHNSYVPADLPAQQGGTLQNIAVKVGDRVEAGDLLAAVDNELEKLSLAAATERLAMAEEEANNDVNVRYATTAAQVHEYRYTQVKEAVEKEPDTFTKSQVITFWLQAEQFRLQTEQAVHEQDLAEMSLRVREAESKLAEHELARREIRAPVTGVIEEVMPVVGDWVRAGDPIVRLVQMDRLRIKGALLYDPHTPASVRGKPVLVKVHLAGDSPNEPSEFTGVVDSASSTIGRDGRFDISVEVENRQDPITGDWLLMPGMNDATIEITK